MDLSSKSAESVVPDREFWAATRQDLVASVAAFREGSRLRHGWLAGAGTFGGFALALGLVALTAWLHWPPAVAWVFVGFGWAVSLGSLAVILRRQQRLTNKWQWACPNCAELLIAKRGINPLARAEIAIATGRCPACGEPLFPVDA